MIAADTFLSHAFLASRVIICLIAVLSSNVPDKPTYLHFYQICEPHKHRHNTLSRTLISPHIHPHYPICTELTIQQQLVRSVHIPTYQFMIRHEQIQTTRRTSEPRPEPSGQPATFVGRFLPEPHTPQNLARRPSSSAKQPIKQLSTFLFRTRRNVVAMCVGEVRYRNVTLNDFPRGYQKGGVLGYHFSSRRGGLIVRMGVLVR